MPSDWLSTLLPLVGVALGASGAFAGQYLATRETKHQARLDAEHAIRDERKQAIKDFLRISQKVERVAEHRWQNDNTFVEGSPDLTHEMWYRQKCIDLVVSEPVREAARKYAWYMSEATYGRVPEGMSVWGYLTEAREPFLAAARSELGISDPP
jgi:hypothetical protein